MNIEEKKRRLAELREETARLEKELGERHERWQHGGEYYGLYHATAGLMLGVVGAVASLLFNVIGSLVTGQHALKLIQVYLTFPLGEDALSEKFDTGIVMAVGCCLYIGTGMLLGVPFQMAMARFLPDGRLPARLMLATVLGLILWGFNFYVVLAWLQPLLIGGNWITDPSILPWWVGAATHLVFAWTMALIYPWGKYEPHRQRSDSLATA